ncbi:hypothetical protein L9F63_000373 [Diploptera punctata]|uniref:C2H2-type domain-containing protein n=1 Tax=Diploptera punctata TaxID=6984 RepID=A0AAD8AMP8_DIPPU|nr:hypothetical protein L9F63_000373 [Diploptera punctata]
MSALNRHKRKKHENEDFEMDPFVDESEDEEMNEEESLDFPDQSSLSKHKGWHSRKQLEADIKMPSRRRKIYVCGFCNKSFANSGSLSKHRKLNCPPKRNCSKNLMPTGLIQEKSVFQTMQNPMNVMRSVSSPFVNSMRKSESGAVSTLPRIERMQTHQSS